MNSEEQKQFVRNLTKSIAGSIIQQIDAGKIPEHWDGAELRELIYQRANNSRTNLIKGRNKRANEFHNIILTNNLT